MLIKDINSGIGQSIKLRDYSEPLLSQKENTAYTARSLSVIDFDPAITADDIVRYENENIKIWRAMSKNPYVKFAIDDIVNEMISLESNEIFPIKLDIIESDIPENIKNKINDEFDILLRLLEFPKKGISILSNWYIDGKITCFIEFNNKNGIENIILLDPLKIKKIKKENKNNNMSDDEYSYIYYDNDIKSTPLLIEFTKENVIETNSGIMDDLHKIWVSPLYFAVVALNQVVSIEDALVIYRLSRAPERRVFYVDVGELPKTKAEAYMKDLIRNFRNNVEYDSETGKLKEANKHSSILDDIWLPRQGGGKGTEVSTIQGAQNLSNIDDLEYFLKKLFRSLKVPFSRWNDNDSAANVIGRTPEITRDEVKYSKFIYSLRIQFNFLLLELLKKQLSLKNIMTYEEFNKHFENIKIVWNSDMMFAELKQMDILMERINVLEKIEPFKSLYFSNEYILRNILKFTDKEIEEIKNQQEQDPLPEPEENENSAPKKSNLSNIEIKSTKE